MKRSAGISLVLLALLSGTSSAVKKISHEEYYFRANAVYTITYIINEKETRTLDEAYFKEIWISPAYEREYTYMAPKGSPPQENYKWYYLVEFWKEYPDGKQESYLIPMKNMVEVRYIVKKSSSR